MIDDESQAYEFLVTATILLVGLHGSKHAFVESQADMLLAKIKTLRSDFLFRGLKPPVWVQFKAINTAIIRLIAANITGEEWVCSLADLRNSRPMRPDKQLISAFPPSGKRLTWVREPKLLSVVSETAVLESTGRLCAAPMPVT